MHVQSLGKNQTIVTVKDNNGRNIECLYSYETPVAIRCANGLFKTERKWSVTTSRHVNKFIGAVMSNVTMELPQEEFDNWNVSEHFQS